MCAWLGLSAYGSYDHRNTVEADRAQCHAKIIIPVRAAYRARRGTNGVGPADGAPQPSIHNEPVPARQPAYGFAVHAPSARQELSNERR
jgi:hypothetical protein